MNTLVEASSAFNVGAGIGRYARNILTGMIAESSSDQWILARAKPARGESVYFDAPGFANTRTVTLPVNRRDADRIWHRLGLPVDLRLFAGRGPDIVYSPEFMAPPMFRVPRVITVHDLAFLTHPDFTTEALRRFLSTVVPRQVERADRIVVVSHAVKGDVVRLLGVPAHRIIVARNGVDSRFLSGTPLSPERKKALGLPGEYFLMVGTIEPRKNHLNTLRAFERAGVGRYMPLVMAGRPGWAYEEALDKARHLELKGEVLLMDYVPDDDLPGLYTGATAVFYPSVTEGFGLPIIEALASGTQVLTGTAPALREVGGEFAEYVEPDDIDQLAGAMRSMAETVCDSRQRQERTEWARGFSWDESAATVLATLRDVCRS